MDILSDEIESILFIGKRVLGKQRSRSAEPRAVSLIDLVSTFSIQGSAKNFE